MLIVTSYKRKLQNISKTLEEHIPGVDGAETIWAT